MTLSAKDTSKALRAHVYPLLREAGFDDWTTRKAWRHRGDRIDHIEFVSFSSYSASVLGCTTASLGVRVGVSLPKYGSTSAPYQKDYIKSGPNGPRPDESQMPIRGVLCRSDAPALIYGKWGKVFDWVFAVNCVEDTDIIARDIASQLDTYALDWISREWDAETLLTALASDATDPILVDHLNGSHLWLAAEMPNSPIRKAHMRMVNSMGQKT